MLTKTNYTHKSKSNYTHILTKTNYTQNLNNFYNAPCLTFTFFYRH